MCKKLGSSLGTRLLGVAIGLVLVTWLAVAMGVAEEKEAPATFVGSATCKACHAKVHDAWTESTHGKALSRDTLASERKGCEACHGPASLHVGNPMKVKPFLPKADEPAKTNALCGVCHFKTKSTEKPEKWQNVTSADWARSMHGRRKLSCLSCHTGHPNGNDKALIKPAKELCITCHASVLEDSPGKPAAYTHSPVAQGQCMTCHDPHGSTDRRMVKDNVEKACETCHKPDDAKLITAHSGYPIAGSKCHTCHDVHSHNLKTHLVRTTQHGPFAGRKCEMCHTKPEKDKPIALVKPVKELCVTCHPVSSLVRGKETAHWPVQQGLCTTCHDPHAGNGKGIFKTRLAYACFQCHTKVEDDTLRDHRHKILEDKLNCMLCHKPHGSVERSLLVKKEKDLCGQCHKHSGSHPMDVKEDGTPVIDPRTKKQMYCESCHNVHGSDFEVMAIANSKRDLCVKCHDVGH